MSQTAVLPKPDGSCGSPIGRLNNICRSPRSEPDGNTLVPGFAFDGPRCPSTTSKNCPTLWMKTRRPLSSINGVGVGVS